jgi:hypothetical protein
MLRTDDPLEGLMEIRRRTKVAEQVAHQESAPMRVTARRNRIASHDEEERQVPLERSHHIRGEEPPSRAGFRPGRAHKTIVPRVVVVHSLRDAPLSARPVGGRATPPVATAARARATPAPADRLAMEAP